MRKLEPGSNATIYWKIMQRYNEAKRNVPSDHEILAAVNERARQMVNAEAPGETPLPEGYRCDMSRVGFIRRRWERAVEEYRDEHGIDPIEALRRIEAELRNPINAPVLYA